MIKMAFIIPPSVEMSDLAGPVQVFTEAKFYGFDIALEFYSYQQEAIRYFRPFVGESSELQGGQINGRGLSFYGGNGI